MLVGQLLLQRGWVAWDALALALDDQRGTDVRIVSLLIARRAITFEHGARALATQHGTPGVLRHHLEHRTTALAALLPIDVIRGASALPIGHMRDGTLIVAVRDPSATLHARLARQLAGPFVLAVAPAAALDHAIEEAIAARATDDIDITIDPGASGELEIDLAEPDPADEIAVVVEEPVAEVAKPRATTSRPLPVEVKPTGAAARAPAADSVEGTIAALEDVDDLAWLLDVVMACLAKRWRAALVLAVSGDRATAARAHGATRSRDALALAAGSLLQLARERRRVVHDVEPGPADAELVARLDRALHPVVAPVLRGDDVAYLIAVGDPRDGDPGEAAADIAALADAIGEVLARVAT